MVNLHVTKLKLNKGFILLMGEQLSSNLAILTDTDIIL